MTKMKLKNLVEETEKLAEDMIEFSKILSLPHLFCPTCKKMQVNRPNWVSLVETGECLGCDHVEGDR